MSNVLVIFQANTEHTEQLALAVAVGAVESEASIRLRRLASEGAVEVAHKSYGKLQRADLIWADTVVVGLEDARPRVEELDGLVSVLNSIDPGELDRKQAWAFGAEGMVAERTEAQLFVEGALQAAGMTVLPAVVLDTDDMLERMKEVGRRFGRRPSHV
jgi:hypothetical protein